MDIEEYQNKMMEEIRNNSSIPKANYKVLTQYVDYLAAKQLPPIKPVTRVQNVYYLKHFLEVLGNKNVRKVSKEDMVAVVAKLNQLEYSKKLHKGLQGRKLSFRTVCSILISVKTLYKHLLGEDEEYPKNVKWIDVKIPEKKIANSELLTEDEVMSLLKYAKSLRDKALIAVMYETGCRVGELNNIKLKDISLADKPVHLKLDGKTGVREVAIISSVPYLTNYLESKKELGPDDIIWRNEYIGEDKKTYGTITVDAIRFMLRIAARDAGILKKCNPHAFRHARASFVAKHLPDAALNKYFGWKQGSNTSRVYVSLADRDVDAGIQLMNGIKVEESILTSKIKVWECTVCKQENGVEIEFCTRCRNPKSIVTEIKLEEKLRALEEKTKWLEQYVQLDEPEDIRQFVEGKSVEQIKREKEARKYFLEHESELMQAYVDSMVYSEENYGEPTPVNKKRIAEWYKKQGEMKNDNEKS